MDKFAKIDLFMNNLLHMGFINLNQFSTERYSAFRFILLYFSTISAADMNLQSQAMTPTVHYTDFSWKAREAAEMLANYELQSIIDFPTMQ